MIYTTCLMIYAGLSYSQSTSFRILLASFLIGLSVFITVYYHYLQDPTFHQNAYALLTAVVLLRSMYVMERNIRPQWETKERALKQGMHTNGSTNGALSPEQAV